jgi:hypothetical protein
MNRLIERYLLHIKSHLPKSLRDDVAAEIEEGLRQQVEERQSASGRPVSDDELNDMLTAWGHPVEVAGRYLPQQYLIGPSTFPAYWNTLRALVAVFAAIAVIKVIIVAATGDDWRLIVNGIGNTAWGLLAWAGIITVVFAVIDQKGLRFFDRFDARTLRDRHLSAEGVPAQPIPRFESAFDFVFGAVLLLWWVGALGVLSLPGWQIRDWQFQIFFVDVSWGEGFPPFFYPVVVLLVLGLARAARNFVRPYWTLPAMAARVAHNILWVGVLIWATRTADLVSFSVAENAPNPERLATALPDFERSFHIFFILAIVISAIRIVIDISRIIRYRT